MIMLFIKKLLNFGNKVFMANLYQTDLFWPITQPVRPAQFATSVYHTTRIERVYPIAFSKIGSSSSTIWYTFVKTEFLKNGLVSKKNSSLKPLGSSIRHHLISFKYLRASSSRSEIWCKTSQNKWIQETNSIFYNY